LSINENECNTLAQSINFDCLDDSIQTGNNDLLKENVQVYLKRLAKKIGINIDLHANNYTAWSDGEHTAFSSTNKVKINNLVGAGDAWDAADIVGYLVKLNPQERLVFSNAYVSHYVSNNPNSEPATMKEVLEILRDGNNNKKY
jgi:fructose-1-phosphate kinase PfkB-like protein